MYRKPFILKQGLCCPGWLQCLCPPVSTPSYGITVMLGSQQTHTFKPSKDLLWKMTYFLMHSHSCVWCSHSSSLSVPQTTPSSHWSSSSSQINPPTDFKAFKSTFCSLCLSGPGFFHLTQLLPVPPFSHKCHNFTFLYGWIVIHWLNTLHILPPFSF